MRRFARCAASSSCCAGDLKLFTQAVVAIDGSKFKAVNSRDRNFTPTKIDRRIEQIEESIQRYLEALETADRTQPTGGAGQDQAADARRSSGCASGCASSER